MLSSTLQTESSDDGARCGNCQHSVDVRGMQQIVCLAHLAVLHPGSDGGCAEFECKRENYPAPTNE